MIVSDSDSVLVAELLSPTSSSSYKLGAGSEPESEGDRTSTLGGSLPSRLPGPRLCGPAPALMTFGIPILLRMVEYRTKTHWSYQSEPGSALFPPESWGPQVL